MFHVLFSHSWWWFRPSPNLPRDGGSGGWGWRKAAWRDHREDNPKRIPHDQAGSFINVYLRWGLTSAKEINTYVIMKEWALLWMCLHVREMKVCSCWCRYGALRLWGWKFALPAILFSSRYQHQRSPCLLTLPQNLVKIKLTDVMPHQTWPPVYAGVCVWVRGPDVGGELSTFPYILTTLVGVH